MPHPAGPPAVGGATAVIVGAGETQAVPSVGATQVHVPPPDPVIVDHGGPAYAPPPPEKRSWAFLIALLLLLAVLAGLLVLLARSLGVGEDDDEPDVVQVEVPRVVDLPAAEARRILEAAGFGVEEAPEQVVDIALVDIVLRQTPEGGIRVDEGSTVEIVVGSQNTFAMPDLRGVTPDSARNTLRGLEFTGEVTEVPEASDEVEVGQIIRTEPPAGEQVATTATITFVVSSGPPKVVVPGCDGLTESDCVARISDAGLNPQVVTEPSGTVEQGRVIRVEGQGTEVDNGATVRIVVSSGPQLVTVPPVVGLDEADAVAALEDEGFNVDVVNEVVEDPDDIGKVQDQNPDGNTQAPAGSTVTITVGEAGGD